MTSQDMDRGVAAERDFLQVTPLLTSHRYLYRLFIQVIYLTFGLPKDELIITESPVKSKFFRAGTGEQR